MRILFVEDEHEVAHFLARSLSEHAYTVDIAATGEEGLRKGLTDRYDAILLDVRLPKVSGIEVCRELRQAGIDTPILIVTARTLVSQRVEGLEAGADDYLTKPFALAELHARIRALIRRSFNRGAKLHYADLQIDRHRRQVTRRSKVISLTSKEFALLELLMLHAPGPVTRNEIIEHVWDSHLANETNLVEVYVNRLRQKVDQAPAMKLIQTVRGEGYRLRESND
jgi:DNA-binding response OmpR family regulator